jgi:hypothetical protein
MTSTTVLRDRVATEGGFDSTLWNASIVSWLDDKHAEALRRSKWYYAEGYSFGSTTANVSVYTLAETVGQIDWLEVGGQRYVRVSPEQMDGLHDGTQFGDGSAGYFSDTADVDADPKQVRIYPAPEVTGTAITGRVTLIATALDTTTNNPKTPPWFDQYLVAGGIAQGERFANKRPDQAAPLDAMFEQGVTELTRSAKARVGGSRATSIPVKGFHLR